MTTYSMTPEEISRTRNFYKLMQTTALCSFDKVAYHYNMLTKNDQPKFVPSMKLKPAYDWNYKCFFDSVCDVNMSEQQELNDYYDFRLNDVPKATDWLHDDGVITTSESTQQSCMNNYDNSVNDDLTIKFTEPDTKPEPEQKPAEEDDESFMTETDYEYADALNLCRDIFSSKLEDYGTAWRIMRPQSVTDQIYIKANRIRSLEECGISKVGEGILPEFMAIVNYGIVGLIQLELGFSDSAEDLPADRALELYDKYAQTAYELMNMKNHDYNEAWRLMRVCSYTDFILMKICRTKQIEAHNGKTKVSEGIDANYLDMINYAIFAIIKMTKNND